MYVPPSFGRWLKERRKALDLTQEALAERVGCAAETLRRYEAERLRPSREVAARIAEQLQLPLHDRVAFVHAARAVGTTATPMPRHHAGVPPTPLPRHTHLPVPLTPLIGRVEEIATVCGLLKCAEVRLLTLVGAPGIGKTRLSLQVAADLQKEFANGVVFVALAPVSDPQLVLSAIAQVLGVKDLGNQELIASLKAYLHTKHLLLVLDNFEHVVDAAPQLADVLQAAPQVQALVTSRTPLHIYGEYQYSVPLLPIPNRNDHPSIEKLLTYEAVRLFVTRVQAVQHTFALTIENAEAVVEICQRLDGLPLAIELAAARAKLFSLEVLQQRLGARLAVLTDGPRNLPVHQQTLRNAIAWSYGLLEPAEQQLFARLGVFAGGWTVDAAEAVCNANGDLLVDVLDGLHSLLDKSLVRLMDGMDEEPRFTMLETIREYALERLTHRGEEGALRQYHATYYVTLSETAEWQLNGPGQRGWLNRLKFEHHNLRTALTWAFESGNIEAGLRMAAGLWLFWHTHGHLHEGRAWLEQGLSRTTTLPDPVRAKALNVAGWLVLTLGDFVGAQALLDESVALFRALGDREGLAWALTNLGYVATLGEYRVERVPTLLTEVMALRPALQDQRLVAHLLVFAGLAAVIQNDWDQAVALHEEALVVFRKLQYGRGITMCLTNLGLLALVRSDLQAAVELFHEDLHIAHDLDDLLAIQYALMGLAAVAAADAHTTRAARLWGASEAVREATGILLTPLVRSRTNYDARLLAAQSRLGKARFEAMWTQGQTMKLEDAIAYALENTGETLG